MHFLFWQTEFFRTSYKLALKTGFYEFQAARDMYREATVTVGMHKVLVLDWIKKQALILNPIAPHWAEYVWQELLKQVHINSYATIY
jgi:leucyl-tRNA synthetase